MKYFWNTAAKKVLVLVSPCGLMKAHQKWLWASSARKTLQELRGLCELEALSAILFVPLFLFLQIPVLSFPSLPSASVPNAVVEGTKCGWDAVRRANAHLPFHNMPCDFCVDYVKKKRGGYFCFPHLPNQCLALGEELSMKPAALNSPFAFFLSLSVLFCPLEYQYFTDTICIGGLKPCLNWLKMLLETNLRHWPKPFGWEDCTQLLQLISRLGIWSEKSAERKK